MVLKKTFHSNGSKLVLWLGALLALFALSIAFERLAESHQQPEQGIECLERHLNKHSAQLKRNVESALDSFIYGKKISFSQPLPANFASSFDKNSQSLYFFHEGRLAWWSDHTAPADVELLKQVTYFKILNLKNGIYLAYGKLKDLHQVVGLKRIFRHYSYQNDYLENGVEGPCALNYAQISDKEEPDSHKLRLNESLPLYIKFDSSNKGFNIFHRIALLTWVLAWVLLLGLAIRWSAYKQQWKWSLFILLVLVGIRIASFYYQWPTVFYAHSLFTAVDYAASSWLPSLGDLLFNVAVGLACVTVFYFTPFVQTTQRSKPFQAQLFAALHAMAYFGIAWLAFYLIVGLIEDSNIFLDIFDFLNIQLSGYLAFGIISMLLIGLLILGLKSRPAIFHPSWHNRRVLINIAAAALLMFWCCKGEYPVSLAMWFLWSIALLYILHWAHQSKFSLKTLVILLAWFAFGATGIVSYFEQDREWSRRKTFAIKLAEERDPILENIFADVARNIVGDSLIKRYLQPGSESKEGIDLAQRFFSGYWEKYSINFQVFGNDDCALSNTYSSPDATSMELDALIEAKGVPCTTEDLYYINNETGRITYMARLDVPEYQQSNKMAGRIYVEMVARFSPEEIGYPELLLDRKALNLSDISNYSIARYKNGSLVSIFGNFNYSNLQPFTEKLPAESAFESVQSDGYLHLIYNAGENLLVWVSTPQRGLLGLVSPFSYWLIWFSLLFLIYFLQTPSSIFRFRRALTFRRKIQLSFVAMLLLLFGFIGWGSIYFIIQQNKSKNEHAISEKIRSLASAIKETGLIDRRAGTVSADEWAAFIKMQADIFFNDINVFDPSGHLLVSSQPKLFDEGLVSKRINPKAYGQLLRNMYSEVLVKENIGKLNYLSAYLPLLNAQNQVACYLNVPYFARENEIRKELSTFVVAIVNAYVLLALVVFIAALILANTVTGPLQLIRTRLASTRLGTQNETIEWQGQDEIADLIAAYNRMVSELSESAEKLARSERESAWREMAKQVAHEIKNPLTPMKLSVQMLKRAWDDKAPDWEDRLERFTQMLSEQIETLSHIASEFSNFAQMPRMKPEKIDLATLLQNAVAFHQNPEGPIVKLILNTSQPIWVITDREQMLRVFNNLLKNAIQAIKQPTEGCIEIRCKTAASNVIVDVEDNGSGIEPELQDKIFAPNFTTKKSGMGLGLALVKNIVENSRGSVTFATSSKGTCFTVTLPMAKTAHPFST